jgi:hypothetical protein
MLRYTNLFILYGIRRNCHSSGRNLFIVPIHTKGDKTDCCNYQRISLLSTAYKMLSNILLARVTPYVSEIIGDHQCGSHHNRSTTD